jgi:4-aminobutyrate aminotransferase-like enzyme
MNNELLKRRYRLLGEKAPLFYDEPVHIVRGEGVWLYDADGRRYLDVYNNVPHVGHCHPHVVEALTRQAGTLNVHTRYLHETILDYAERLTATLDPGDWMALFTCSGSESNDTAMRMARMHTGAQGIICTNFAYHGNTEQVWEIGTVFTGGVAASSRIRAVNAPDSYRGKRGLGGDALGEAFADEVKQACESLQESGQGVAGMLVCPIYSSEGLPVVPPGYMEKAVDHVRKAGGLFISDEVQAGFGRTGRKMWGHQLYGVTADIITMGKPMGNGHPLAGMLARAALLNEFRDHEMYFNTFGGNPVSCAVGMAVLDVLEQEKLLRNAVDTGDYVQAGLRTLQDKHHIIGDVRGQGLFFGVELVTDRTAKTPATDEAKTIINCMRDEGILISRIGPHDNVLKMRPPMPFSREHADLLLSTLDGVLASL